MGGGAVLPRHTCVQSRPVPPCTGAPTRAIRRSRAALRLSTMWLLSLPDELLANISSSLVQQYRLNSASNTVRDIASLAMASRCVGTDVWCGPRRRVQRAPTLLWRH